MRWTKITTWYERYERHISSLSLLGGFIFDALTLKRVDMFLENFWVVIHLLVAALCIIILNLIENRREKISEIALSRFHFWLVITIQFAFGGLLSTFLVFYFRSASLAASWPFLLFLALVFISNELLKQHYTRLMFQTIVLFISIYSFAIFIIPVLVHSIGTFIFLISGAVSIILISIFIALLWLISQERFKKSWKIILVSIAGITLVINILYFTHSIPPIPLSLKEAGVYNSIMRDSNGNYVVQTSENFSFLNYLKLYDPVQVTTGGPLYVYTAVFSPTKFNNTIVHVWQHYDENQKKWIDMGRVTLPIVGGRDGGYRTYSVKSNVLPGLWRVNVDTLQGEHIGRVQFDVTATDTPSLIPEIL